MALDLVPSVCHNGTMDLAPYIDSLRHELAVAAEAGGEDARALADRLTSPLAAAARLVLLEALSTAADEITRELAPGSVEVRLHGRDPDFVVTRPPVDEPVDDVSGTVAGTGLVVPADDGGGTARLNLRLPESLKARIDAAAEAEGLSLNVWLVRAAAGALEGGLRGRSTPNAGRRGGDHFTGWVR